MFDILSHVSSVLKDTPRISTVYGKLNVLYMKRKQMMESLHSVTH